MESGLDFSLRRSVPLILQSEISECGLASMAMIASYHGHKVDMSAMRKRFTAGLKGMHVQDLINLGDQMGLASRALQCSLEEVDQLRFPCILHWNMNHFVVLTKVVKRGVSQRYFINDPATGKRELNQQEFSNHFTGICLELSPTSGFEAKIEETRMKFYQLWSRMTGLKSGLVKLVGLSLVLQVYAILNPYYMQLVVDEVLVGHDESLLVVLGVGFALIVLLSTITSAIRSWLVLRLASVLNMQLGVNLLHHMLRLPLNYFESRHVGDIVSRFGSLSNIRERITSGIVETFVDGVMSIAVLVMMFLYSTKLTFVVIAAVLIYVIFRIVWFRNLKLATENLIQNSAKEQSHFLESVRGMQTIKMHGQEIQRQNIWQNLYSQVVNSDIRLGRLGIGFESVNSLLFALESVLVIYLAASLVLENNITVGIMLAFVAYKMQFTQRISNLVEQLIQFKMMRLHLDRISDIALTPTEASMEGDLRIDQALGILELRDICFHYGDHEPVLTGVNLKVEAGSTVVIRGASGSGKTTLLKIMMGLLSPTSGTILFDGHDITRIGLQNYRKKIGAVMQDDTLLAGSIGENITFFSDRPDELKIQSVADLAFIRNDIEKMTMGYNTMVGDMGASLSGGQIQRILLARALYRDPVTLFLDEATSNLDENAASTINENIAQLNITRIVITHRKESPKNTASEYELADGVLILSSP